MDELRVGEQVEVLEHNNLGVRVIGKAVITKLEPDETNGPYSRVTVCYSDDLEATYRPDRIKLIGTEDDGA
jgi:hypothetical protein